MSDVNYPGYLALDELLSLQRARSTPEHPDELLFIVVHQASELWFKVILRDLDGLIAAMQGDDAGLAYWYVRRLNTVMRIVSTQLSSLDALPPQHFAQFRGYLGTSSGSQSVQFRAIEAASGLRDTHFMHALAEHGPIPAAVQRVLDRPTLQDLFLGLVERAGTSLEALYTGPGPGTLFFLAEGLLEYEQQFAEWRFKHVLLVERIIGPNTGGTGGTLGSRYLQRTVSQRFFPRLWEVRARFFGSGGGE
ncbi:MAG TPA: tryptophan 2,3-dioxygenase family protein [Gemmatimonadaceae bacterium]|nr:tryptophan 2,3-dioxygenase family protein [Gemmatimonadaceae bacterium]